MIWNKFVSFNQAVASDEIITTELLEQILNISKFFNEELENVEGKKKENFLIVKIKYQPF